MAKKRNPDGTTTHWNKDGYAGKTASEKSLNPTVMEGVIPDEYDSPYSGEFDPAETPEADSPEEYASLAAAMRKKHAMSSTSDYGTRLSPPAPRLEAEDNPPANPQSKSVGGESEGITGPGRCLTCGEFVGGTSHACRGLPDITPMKKWVTFAPALAAAGTFGVAAATFALGPIALAAAGGALALGALGRFVRRRFTESWENGIKLSSTAKEQRKKLTPSDAAWLDGVQSQVNDLARRLDVPGKVTVVVKTDAAASPAAGRMDGNNAVVFVTPVLRTMTPEQVQGVLAHEVAHLQTENRSRFRTIAARIALPAGLAAGAAATTFAGAAVLPAAALATGVWMAGKVIAAAATRREEARADKVAYKVCGEKFGDALTEIHKRFELGRADLPWRAEDVVFSHPSLENRLADMRR